MKNILVIVDMQNDFTNGVLGNAECEAAVPKIVDLINSKKFDNVVLTRDTHGLDYLDTQEGRKLPVPHCIRYSDGWQIRSEITDAIKSNYKEDDWSIVDKYSFGSTKVLQEVEKYLQNDAIITFCGVCTGICVISNVAIAKATFPENRVQVIEDACACVTPESHKNAIEAMKTFQVDII